MSKRDGNQKGAQQHPQGGHGDRTHKAIVDQLKSHPPYESEKNSEKERLRHERSKGRG